MNIAAKDVKNVLGRNILADGFDQVLDLDKSHGSWIVDARDGTEYLDMFSMYASGAVGYNHPYIIKHQQKLTTAALHKPALSDLYCTHFADFVDTFSRVAIPSYLPHAFFIEGGALAVENALKVAFDWKARKNLAAGRKPLGSQVIHFRQAFHGRTGYTLSLTNTADPRKTAYFPKFSWPRVHNPALTFPLTEEGLRQVAEAEQVAIQEIQEAIANNPHDIAAVILEPIQGEGGDNHFRNEFFVQLRELCDENEIFLIFDEVQTGLGITGKMWAHQHYSVKPDAICFGKKSQVCGCLVGHRVDEVEGHVFAESSRINSTFGGNLTDMVRFQLILEVIEQENLVTQAESAGRHLLSQLQELSAQYPGMISNPRGLGLFAAFDLPDGSLRDHFCTELQQRNILILGCGERSIRFRPHLIVSNSEIDHAIAAIEGVCQEQLAAK